MTPLILTNAIDDATTYRVQLLHRVPVCIASSNVAVLQPSGAPPWWWAADAEAWDTEGCHAAYVATTGSN